VADTGVGMDKNLTDKIFDPFFTTKEIGKGTGMGLSVVHGIVTAMGGAIQVYSEPGKGTEFQVFLPVVKTLSEKQATNSHAQAQIQGGTEQILLVDDEEAILSMEKRMLERLGYQVTSRFSSLEALEAFRTNPDKFDLVITDMAMPNMAGDKLSAELTKIRPDIPVLLCTGFSETMSEEKAAALGIKGFIFKPIVMKDLAQKIREVLDK
jgi:CheY-like chemotaxis protein